MFSLSPTFAINNSEKDIENNADSNVTIEFDAVSDNKYKSDNVFTDLNDCVNLVNEDVGESNDSIKTEIILDQISSEENIVNKTTNIDIEDGFNKKETNNEKDELYSNKTNIKINEENSIHTIDDLNNDASLSHIGFNGNNPELTETFNPQKKDYTAIVKGNATSFMFYPIWGNAFIATNDINATMDIYLNEELIFEDINKTPTKTFNLVKGIINVLKIAVTAENGEQSIYTVTFQREGYNDSSLSHIGFNGNNPELTEIFNPQKKDYNAIVKDGATSFTFYPIWGNAFIATNDANATMDIYLNEELIFEDINKTPTKTFNLVKGITNVLKIVVYAEGGDQSVYTVTFRREGYNDSSLSHIGFNGNNPELTEIFNPQKKDYTAIVKGSTTSFMFYPIWGNAFIAANDANATMDIYLNEELIFEDINKTPTKTFNLVKGITNVLKIIVYAESGDQSIYTVTFERELDSNTNITNLSINKGLLEIENDVYTATMNSWQDISLSKLILEDFWANYRFILNDKKEIALNEKFNLDIGDNRLDIEVISNNGTKKTYPVIFKRSDNVNPSVNYTVDNKDWTNEDILINIDATDDSGIKYIELPNGEKVYSSTAEFYINQNGTYIFKIYDNFLNESIETIEINNIDKELPELTLKASTAELTNDSVDILIEASDNVGIKYIENPYGELITKNTLSYKVHEDGTYEFKVVDLAGNETVKSITLNNIDSINPILATELSNDDWSNEELTLSVFAISDKGIKYIELPDGSKIENNFAEYEIKENGTYFIATESLGGNITSEKVVVNNIDTELPTLSLNSSTEDWTNEDVDIIVNAEDNIGIDYIVLPDGQIVYESNYNYIADSNGIYEFAIVDLAGNKTSENIEIKNIDKNPPIVKNYDSLVSILNNTVTLDLSTIETPSGIHKVILPNKEEVVEPEGDIIEYEVKYNDTYTFTVVDRAGNSVNVDVKVDTLIDREDSTNSNIPSYKEHMPDTSGINEIVVIISLISAIAGLMILKNRRR